MAISALYVFEDSRVALVVTAFAARTLVRLGHMSQGVLVEFIHRLEDVVALVAGVSEMRLLQMLVV